MSHAPEEQRAAHDDLVRMYLEQDAELERAELASPSLRSITPSTEWYEPIVALRREKITIGAGSRIDSFVKLEGGEGLTIGRYVHIASFAHIGIGGGTTILEDGSAVASGGKIISGSNSPSMPSMSASAPADQQAIERKTTRLCENAVVCTNAVVLPGVTLHRGAILAAGGVATKDIPAFQIWGGQPAKFIRWRRDPSEDFRQDPSEDFRQAPDRCVCGGIDCARAV